MKKCVRMYVLVMIAITEFVSCSHIGTVSVAETTTTDSVTMSTDASPASKKLEELALLAVTGNYIATEDEMEASLKSFLETHVNTNSARNVTSASTYTFAQSKKENINTTFNSIGGFSARSATTASDTVPIYYYTVDTGKTELVGVLDDTATDSDVESYQTQEVAVTDLAIMTTDRRIGTVLAYVEHCSLEDIENLADEGSSLAIFLANLDGYIQVTAELWNTALTSDYITAAERSITARSATASEVVLSGAYTDSDGTSHSSSGHCWIIDGYANLSCTASSTTDTSTTVTLTADYVHCDWGWDNYKNGYYLSSVFDAQYYPLYTTTGDNSTTRSATSNAAYYYQYSLYIVPNITPGE